MAGPPDDDEIQSQIIATPRSGRSERAATPATGPGAETTDSPPRARMARPKGIGDPLGKRLLKQSLFPGRAQPVQIGRFSVLRLIGRGGMGAVYACYDDLLDRKVAVKILQLDARHDRDFASARLIREGQALAKLSHPNVVTVHEVGRTDDRVFVAMEFVRGASLDAWATPARSWREILAAFLQAGRGLVAAHQVGIVHRDFKPQNVIMSEEGLVKVLDFGLARASGDQVREEWFTSQADDAAAESSELMRPLTRTGTLIGTPAYMSPEQHRGELAGMASDQFSFCVSLYQCLYGALPFSARSFAALRSDVLQGQVAPAPLRSSVPARVFKALRRGMAVDPAARFPSMSELLTTLERDPASIQRRVAALIVTAVATGVTGFVLADVGRPAVEQCPDARAELAGIWDEGAAEAIRGAARATGSPRADEVLTLLPPQLERYADEWVQVRNDACRAHAEGRQSEHIFKLRTACLDQRRAGLRALVEGFASIAAASLDELAEAAVALPPLDRCADAQALLAAVAPPDDAELRARVEEHRQSLARAQVLADAGQHRRGLELVERVLTDETALAHEPLLAEAYLHKGSLQMASGDGEHAVHSFDRSLWVALGAGHRSVAAQASARAGYLRAVQLDQLERAKADLPVINGLNRRAQRDIDLYADYLNDVGRIHAVAGDRTEARQMLESARDLLVKHGREFTPRSLGTLMKLGIVAKLDGRIEDMERTFRRLGAASQQLLGPTHRTSLNAEVLLAMSLLDLGRPQEARDRLHRTPMHVEGAENEDARGQILRSLATCELVEGNESLARRHLSAALPLTPTTSHDHDEILRLMMRAAASEGDESAMRSYQHAASKRLGAAPEPNDLRPLLLLRDHALALEALGRPREALASFERLRSMLGSPIVQAEPELAAQVAFGLGRSYHKLDDHVSAERELQRARAGLHQGWPVMRADILQALGELALDRQRGAEAIEHLTVAESIYAATVEADFIPYARARFALARALTGAASLAPAPAHAHARAALDALRAKGRADEAREVESWLAEHG